VVGDPLVGVLALQGDVREHLAALRACGAAACGVRRPSELDDVDALVIPGGESTTMSKLAIEFGLLDPIRKRIAGGMPAYGSCAGMIMLATDLLDGRPDQRGFDGIEMTVRRNAFGRQVDSFEEPVEIDGIEGGPFHAVFIRAPVVERVGDGVEVLGRVVSGGASGVDRGGHASSRGRDASSEPAYSSDGRIVAVRQQQLLATAFHPELTGDLRVHRYFVDMVRAAAGQTTKG
jgi:5'-phosphate synthase pdxT subunit